MHPGLLQQRGPARVGWELLRGYPLGATAYFAYIDAWRRSGTFEGLEIRSPPDARTLRLVSAPGRAVPVGRGDPRLGEHDDHPGQKPSPRPRRRPGGGDRLLVAPAGGSPAGGAPAQTAPQVRTVATGLAVPWGLGFLPDGTALVTERDSARLLSVTPAGQVTAVGTVAGVVPGGEGGLLGLAVSPSFATDRLVFVYYTAASDSRIVRFRFENGQMGAQQVVLSGIPKGTIHNGGRIAFGPDGMLYAGVGETGNTALAQNLSSLGGKILRMTPTGAPAGQPVRHAGVDLRAPQRPGPGLGHAGADVRHRVRPEHLRRGQPHPGREQLRVAHGRARAPTRPSPTRCSPGPRPRRRPAGWPSTTARCGRPGCGAPAVAGPPDGHRRGRHAVAHLTNQFGRLRTAATAPDGTLWVTTSNRDGRGTPTADDDRILALTLGGTDPEPEACFTATNVAHITAGRARAVFFFWASAVGSGDFLGARSATTSCGRPAPGSGTASRAADGRDRAWGPAGCGAHARDSANPSPNAVRTCHAAWPCTRLSGRHSGAPVRVARLTATPPARQCEGRGPGPHARRRQATRQVAATNATMEPSWASSAPAVIGPW